MTRHAGGRERRISRTSPPSIIWGVSVPMMPKAKFDLFSIDVTVACRTIASYAPLLAHFPASQPPMFTFSPPAFNPHAMLPPLCLVVAGQSRTFNFEPGHDL